MKDGQNNPIELDEIQQAKIEHSVPKTSQDAMLFPGGQLKAHKYQVWVDDLYLALNKHPNFRWVICIYHYS